MPQPIHHQSQPNAPVRVGDVFALNKRKSCDRFVVVLAIARADNVETAMTVVVDAGGVIQDAGRRPLGHFTFRRQEGRMVGDLMIRWRRIRAAAGAPEEAPAAGEQPTAGSVE